MTVNSDFFFSSIFKSSGIKELPRYIVFTDAKLTPSIPAENYSFADSITVGDFNNDHLDDVIIAYLDCYTQPLLYLSNGDGTFRLGSMIPEDAATRHVRNGFAVDINKDGFLDYVGFAAPHGFYEKELGPKWDWTEPDLILLNNKGVSFTTVKNLTEDYHHSGGIGDINGDGLIDIFGIAEFPAPGFSSNPRAPLIQNKDGTFTQSSYSLGGIFSDLMITDFRMKDINNDGVTDFIATIGPKIYSQGGPLGTPMASSKVGTIAYAYGNGTLDLNSLNWQRIGEHWMDADLWSKYLQAIYQNPSTTTSFSAAPAGLELLDVNGDGLLDILEAFMIDWKTSGFKYFENTGTSFIDKTSTTFPDQTSNRTIQNPKGFILGFTLADINGDGQKDLILSTLQNEFQVSEKGVGSVSIFINNHGVFEPFDLSKLDLPNVGINGLGIIRVGDFNGDGVPDLFSLVHSSVENSKITAYINKDSTHQNIKSQLLGTSADDVLKSADVSSFRGLAGNDTIIGTTDKLESAVYYGVRSDFKIAKNTNSNWKVDCVLGNEGVDTVSNIERLVFSDKSIALDLSGSAGTTAKILGAVFGKDSLSNKNYMGIGLSFLDSGWTYDNLAGLALDAAGVKTNDQIVSLLWSNVIGTKPTAADKQPFIALLENGMSAGALAQLAADSSYNITNINLVGLAQTGIEYIPVS
jgi:hypothetical protein